MIVPDKKTEAYLNRPVRIKDVVRLCRAGILSPADFLKAVVLCRPDGEWLTAVRKILSVSMFLSFIMAIVLLLVSQWHFFYSVRGGVLLAFLFIACSCARRFAPADYAGAFLIGGMIFLPDMITGSNVLLYEQFLLWFSLLLLWAIPSRRTGVRLLPFVILNVTVALYGMQFVLPFFRMDIDTFCVLSAGLNMLLLFLREKVNGKTKLFDSPAFRFAPVMFSCLFLLSGALGQTLFKSGLASFAYCLIFTFAVGGFFLFIQFDKRLLRLMLWFCALWGSLLLYYGKEALFLNQSFFFVLESLLIVVTVILNRRFDSNIKDKKDGV